MNTREATDNYRLNQWIEIIRECRGSGQTVLGWCSEHGINPRNYYWLRKVRETACEALPELATGNNNILSADVPNLKR